MEVGDLVKYNILGRTIIGVIVRFDEWDDPVVLDFRTKVPLQTWKNRVEVLNESR